MEVRAAAAVAVGVAAFALVGVQGAALTPAHAAAKVPVCHGHRATIYGAGPTLTGTRHRDVIVGTGPGGQVIRAGAGNDLVCAGAGADVIYGGSGNDRLYGGADEVDASDADGDTLDGGPGNDVLDPGFDPRRITSHADDGFLDKISFRDAKHGVTVDLAKRRATGEGHDRLVVKPGWIVVQGSRHGDVIRGTNKADYVDPGPGNDLVAGRGGSDGVESDSGNDVIRLGPGDDRFQSTGGNQTISGGSGHDDIVGTSKKLGRVTVTAGRGDDYVYVIPMRDGDRVSGGPGHDQLLTATQGTAGALSADLGTGLFSTQHLAAHFTGFESWGIDAFGPLDLIGTPGPDQVDTLSDGLTATLLGGDDSITSGTGNRASDDHVDGGEGTDHADLGDGADTCVSIETGPC
jgi:Ca2+-binding RTX toxin-like protein